MWYKIVIYENFYVWSLTNCYGVLQGQYCFFFFFIYITLLSTPKWIIIKNDVIFYKAFMNFKDILDI